MLENQPVATICRICKENCGILVSENGDSLKISGNPRHPISKGFLCFKGKNFGDVHHSPHRLRSPMLKNGSKWVNISYKEAINVLAEKFDRSKAKFGPESVAFYKGESLKHQEITHYMGHLASGFGSPNYISVGSLCHYAMVLGHSLTYGGMPKPDFERIKGVITWGANPVNSSPLLFSSLKRALSQGTKMVVVDPARTRTAELADIHLPIMPGSDGFLALALIKHAVEEERLDPPDELSVGWNTLSQMVRDLSYDHLLRNTGIDGGLFDKAVSLIFENRPGWVLTGLGLELQPVGVQAIRAVACLQSILDPLNRPFPVSAGLKSLPGFDGYPTMPRAIGAEQAPLYVQMKGEAQGMFVPRAILDNDPYPLRAMLVVGGNPLSTFPAYSKQYRAMQGLDFLAVHDLFMTQTAQLADLVLPASDHLDNLELHDYGQAGKPYLGLIKPAVSSPIGWPAWKLLFNLAGRLGLERFFPWWDNRDAIAYRLSDCTIKLEDLENSPAAVLAYQPGSVPTERWCTPGGKVHYRSEKMEAFGYPGLPDPKSLDLPFSTDSEFPLWLSTGDRILAYQHSQFRQIPTYRRQAPEPFVDVHPDAAAKLDIADGDPVFVITRYGRIEIRVSLSDQVRGDCIRITHGWEEANANTLTGLEHFDPISGFPWLRALPAKLEKKDG
ncbi:MAG: molybdopterin-dependent oxidoreductase [Desulfomonile tiedjei]|uniref:Molybdopterin-dependent oxidoreductase n=1 Tax=Desulfomonile tiedjei TaxID=2358 RepID=A0A9D6V5D0_9BACT|nr:molybdopterin-dependent oxidoreductase [Desulfomonile tiedjei]